MRKLLLIVFAAVILMSVAAIPVFAQGVQNVELHGYMQNRFYANPDYSARFVTERVSLSAVGQIGDGTAYIEMYLHPWLTDKTFTNVFGNEATADQSRIYLESAYVEMPFARGRVRIGKGRQLNFGLTPSYPNRKTTQYGILAETFTQDRITGVQYSYKSSTFDLGASLFSDLQVETRSAGDFAGAVNGTGYLSTVKHFVDKDDPGNISGQLAVSARLGVTKPNYQIHVSGMTGGLQQADANFIASQYVGSAATTTDRTHTKYGVDASHTFGPYVIQSEVYQGHFSFVTITGYQVLVGYQPKDRTRLYARWSAMNNDQAPVAAQTTWDTKQLTLGLVQPIRKGVWVELEWEKNMETPPAGTAQKNNDLVFAEFFTGF